MANLNNSSAQQLFEKMQEKKLNASQLSLETLTQQLKAEMKNEFDLSGLNYEDWRNLYGEIGKLIKNAKGLSELDKKRYLVLRRELAFRFPPKLQLTEEAKGKLISRDSLADDIRANREANQGEGRPKGHIKINTQGGIEVNLNDDMYITKIQEFKDYIKNTPESDKKQQHLRELDTQLAELIILNNDCYIQLNNELILDSNSNYKTDDDLRKEALRAIKGLRELEMETEYIQYIEKFKPMFVFDDEFSKEINNNIKALEMKQKNAKLSNRETEMLTVYRDLQGNNITKEKVADAIKHYEDRVQAYNKDEISKEAGVTAVECLDICRRAQKHLNKDEKIHYIVKLVSKEEEPEEEKPEEIKEEEPEEIKETEQEEEPEEIKETEQEEEPEEIKEEEQEEEPEEIKEEEPEEPEEIKEEEQEEPEEIKEEEQEEPEEIKEEDDEISAVLSDVTASYEDMISREVENELTDERNNLSRAHPKKFIRFFNRGSKRKKMIKKKLAEYHEKGPYLQGVAVENEISAETDRHELELQNKIGKVEKKTELHLEPATTTALNQLARDFLENRVGEVEFKRKFNDLITNDTTVRNNRKYFKADFVGSNILEKLKRTKKERVLRKKIADYIEIYTLGRDPRALDNIMPEINTFANEFKTDPSRRKEIFRADGQLDQGKFENFVNHTRAKEALGLNNLKIKLDLLGGGEGAYQINNKDREGILYRFGHLMDKHPWITGGIMAGLTLATGGIVGATAGAVAAGWATAGVVGGTVGFKNFIAKWTHHTKEQNTHEKDLTRDFANVQRKMDQWRADLTKYGKRSRKGYKAKRQLELYEKSTQSTHLFGDTKQFADAILKGATATNLTPNQQNAFHFDVLKAYARLDFYRKQGHNFLKSEDARQIEQDFHALEKALQLVAERNGGTSMTEIPALIGATDPSSGRVINYNDLRADFEKDYTKAKTKFGQERAWLATKWGISTAALAFGTSVGSQYLFNTGIFSDKVSGATEATAGMEAHKRVDVQDLDLPSSANNITGAELADGDNIVYKTGTEVFDKFNNANDTVRIRFGGSTDFHNVIPGGETFINQNYTAQVAEIQKLTDQLVANNLMTSTNRTELLASLDPNQWTSASQTFKNTVLHNTRALEGIEETLRAKLMSGSKAAIQAIYDPTLSTADHYRGLAVVIDATRDAVAANPGTLTSGTQRRSTPLVYLSNTFRRKRPGEEKRYSDDTIMVANNKQGEVEVLKIDTNKNPLSGAKFEVRDSKGNVIDNWETNDIPHKTTGLDAGTYYLVETQAPAGHQKINEVTELIVDEKGNVTRKNVDKSVVPIAPVAEPKKPEEQKKPEEEKPEESKKEKDENEKKNNKAKELAEKKVKISLPHTKPQPIEIDGQTFNVVKVHDRPVVMIDIAGITVPFYMTTGFGGKNLKPGWYPFFGFGKDGRINKTHREDMSNYYEKFVGSEVSVMWESIAEDLAKTYGTDPEALEDTKDVTATEKPISTFAEKFEDYLNNQLMIKPVSNSNVETLEQNIKDIGTKVLSSRNDKAADAEPAETEKTEITSLQELKQKKEAGTIDKAEYRKQLKKLIAQGKVIKF